MRNSERYLASRFGIRVDSMTGERYTPHGWELPETDDSSAPVTPVTSTSSFVYLVLALVSFTALVVLVALGVAPKAQVLSIAKQDMAQRSEITSLARVTEASPLFPCDCRIQNPQWVLERRLPVPVVVPRPGLRPVIPRPNPPVVA
jgi:hypothetical protein